MKVSQLIKDAFITLALSLFFLSLYYFFFLIPKNTLPQTLIDTIKTIHAEQTELIQSRIYLDNLTELDPDSYSISHDKQALLEKLAAINTTGLEKPLDDSPFKPIIYPQNSSLSNYYNDQLIASFVDLTTQQQFFKKQKTLISNLQELSDILNNIYLFPVNKELDSNLDRDTLLANTKNALAGLTLISQNFDNLEIPIDKSNLQNNLTETKNNLDFLINKLDSNSPYQTPLEDTIASFIDLRKTSFKTEVSLLETSSSIDLMVEHSRLISGYSDLIDQLNYYISKL